MQYNNKYMNIFYTGIGCKKSGEHTENEFLDIMNREFTHKNWTYEFTIIPRKNHWQLQFKDWNLPTEFKLFSLNDWIEYSGAEIIH